MGGGAAPVAGSAGLSSARMSPLCSGMTLEKGFEKLPDACLYFFQGQRGYTLGWKAKEGHGLSDQASKTPLVPGDSVLISFLSCSPRLYHCSLLPLWVFPRICLLH